MKDRLSSRGNPRISTVDSFPYFGNNRNVETDIVCFPAPLNACFPLSYGRTTSERDSEDEEKEEEYEVLRALRDSAGPDCYLCVLDDFPSEDWD